MDHILSIVITMEVLKQQVYLYVYSNYVENVLVLCTVKCLVIHYYEFGNNSYIIIQWPRNIYKWVHRGYSLKKCSHSTQSLGQNENY